MLFRPDGSIGATYDKIHLFDATLPGVREYRESATYRGGDQAVVADAAGARLGLTICYDVRFPALHRALAEGGAWPVVLNAANEVAVEAFLASRIRFLDIPVVIETALDACGGHIAVPHSLGDVREADAWARAYAAETLRTLPSS